MLPVLNLIALATFAANLSVRALDPVLPHVSEDLAVSIAQAAGLSAGFAFTFAIIQPLVGAAADMLGKARMMLICLALLGLGNILGTLATSYPMLMATRIMCGIGAGGVFPVALGLTSDLISIDKRQVAIGRVLAGAMIGNILGASAAGAIGDLLGWRGVLLMLGALTVVTSAAVYFGLRNGPATKTPTHRVSLAELFAGYKKLFANPRTRICYSIVFVEGCCVLGIFPFVAAFLFDLGETRLSIAGVVIAGFAVGGLFYTFAVSRMLPVLGMRGLMIGGSSLVALQIAFMSVGAAWQIQTVSFILLGFGFYMLHGTMQVFASELSEEARASSLSFHACFFFLGQTVGPIGYGFGLDHFGKTPTLVGCAVVVVMVGVIGARLLIKRA
ncbi:MAG TPA: MFS transporter [Xanthobacteraceae bacterium]|nr:MFS transporter [Xanthobacteraceae bacterium]